MYGIHIVVMAHRLTKEEEWAALHFFLQPPPFLLFRDRASQAEPSSSDGRKGSITGRASQKWRSTHWRDNLHRLDNRQWKKFFRVSRRVYKSIVARVRQRILRPGRNGSGMRFKHDLVLAC